MKINYIVIILLLISSCGFNDLYYNIPENEKPIYKNGDILIYKSNTGQSDTIIITNFTSDYRDSDKLYYYERIKMDFIGKTQNKLGAITIEFNSLRISWKGVFLMQFELSKQNTINLLVNNKQLNKVYEYSSPDFSYYSSDTIVKLYYHNNKGIVKYIEKGGNTWELTNY